LVLRRIKGAPVVILALKNKPGIESISFFGCLKINEIGAGLGIQPNALRVLQRFGYARENLKPRDFDGVTSFNAKTGDSSTFPFAFSNPSQELHALNCHRSDLHDELKRLATGQGEGPPAQLYFDSKVVACNPEVGTVTASTGEVISADLVLGADGIHFQSVVRTSILGQVVKAAVTGWSCFRCLFDPATLSEFSELDWLTGGTSGPRNVIRRDDGSFLMFWIYAVRNGSLINFVGIHEDAYQDEREWVSTATKAEVLDKFQEFQPKFLRILDLPTTTPIFRWQLRAMPLLPTWIRGRAALLGDAAHATLPLLGQGAAMAIEDAGTLGCLLPFGTKPDEVPSRLEAYQVLRKARGEFVNTESIAQAKPEKRGGYIRSRELQAQLIEHDAIKTAQEYFDMHFGGGIKG
ncbi:FAD/NAD(P)-binding domain-containing protein, partial [Mycena leptocephala]